MNCLVGGLSIRIFAQYVCFKDKWNNPLEFFFPKAQKLNSCASFMSTPRHSYFFSFKILPYDLYWHAILPERKKYGQWQDEGSKGYRISNHKEIVNVCPKLQKQHFTIDPVRF